MSTGNGKRVPEAQSQPDEELERREHRRVITIVAVLLGIAVLGVAVLVLLMSLGAGRLEPGDSLRR